MLEHVHSVSLSFGLHECADSGGVGFGLAAWLAVEGSGSCVNDCGSDEADSCGSGGLLWLGLVGWWRARWSGRSGHDRAESTIIEVIVQLAMTVSVLGGCALCTVGGKKYM